MDRIAQFGVNISKVRSFFMKHGTMRTIHLTHYGLSELWHDYRLGIRTIGSVRDLKTVGVNDKDAVNYFPTPSASLLTAMRRVRVGKNDVFVDFGCGWGRVIVLAARYPFKRILGMDLVEDFVEHSKANVERSRKSSRCRNVELQVANAAQYKLPDDATVLHFYNPFRGGTLDQVIANLKASIIRTPRKVTILYANPEHFERAIADETWIRAIGDDVRFSAHFEFDRPDDNIYRIYECTSPRTT